MDSKQDRSDNAEGKITSFSSTSSIVGLKAELFGKREELRRGKALSGGQQYFKGSRSHQKPVNSFSTSVSAGGASNKGVEERSSRDVERLKEEAKNECNSRTKLEEKARLYEKLSSEFSNVGEESSSDGKYLIDFEKKAMDKLAEIRKGNETAADGQGASGADWVDYVDEFGRTNTCLKEDLTHRVTGKTLPGKGLGQLVKGELVSGQGEKQYDLLSEDMRRELKRQQWEEEMKSSSSGGGPIHYSNVRFDEVREHGTGFFRFSRDEEQRNEELESLKARSDKTEAERLKRSQLKQKRKAAVKERLDKVRLRKKLKGEQQPALEQDLSLDSSDGSSSDTPRKSGGWAALTEEKVKASCEDVKRKGQRDWDRGKNSVLQGIVPPVPSQSKPEDERLKEFAPPSSYYNHSSSSGMVSGRKTVLKRKGAGNLPF